MIVDKVVKIKITDKNIDHYKLFDTFDPTSNHIIISIKDAIEGENLNVVLDTVCDKCNSKSKVIHKEYVKSDAYKLSGYGTYICKFCLKQFYNGNGKQSKGELLIERYLIENEILYKTQYTNERCRNKRLLRFDFAIYTNKKIVSIIEFDGLQHFQKIKGWSDSFEYMQINDKIKEDYCMSVKIPLYRIYHWELEKIDEILKNIFNKNKKQRDEWLCKREIVNKKKIIKIQSDKVVKDKGEKIVKSSTTKYIERIRGLEQYILGLGSGTYTKNSINTECKIPLDNLRVNTRNMKLSKD